MHRNSIYRSALLNVATISSIGVFVQTHCYFAAANEPDATAALIYYFRK
jgi:hypothetical protein